MSRRILIVGERGQLALALMRAYAPRNDQAIAAGRQSLDIADRSAVASSIAALRPALVINAAAYTAVDKAETENDAAFAVNRDGAAAVAAAAHAANAPVIHISTDYVFDGAKSSPYVETDTPGPIGVYGRSKLEGEAAVADANPRHAIIRTSWVCGPDGANFLKTMIRLGRERDEITVVDDQHGAPTFADDLAAAIVAVGERMMTQGGAHASGVYHAANTGATTWCGFARAIMRELAARGQPAARVHPIPTSGYPTPARRPANSRLDCSKIAREFGVRLPTWERSLGVCMDTLFPASQGHAT